jgi:two-component system OmpR family sensor kinase
VAPEIVASANSEMLGLLQDLLDIQALELGQVLSEACTCVARWFSCEKADAFLYDPQRTCLVALGTSVTPLGKRQKALGLDVLPLANGGRIVQVYQTGVPHQDGHVELDSEEVRGIVHDLGVRSQVTVPLTIDGTRRGVLSIVSQRPEHFKPEDARTIELVGSWLGTLAHRAELVQRLRADELERGRSLAADELLTVLAHDIWNHLNPLSARLHLLRLRVTRRETIDEAQLDAALMAVQRLARLTHDNLDYILL